MRRHAFGLPFLVVGLLTFCARGHADTLQENFGPFTVNFLTGTPVTGAVRAFTPDVGTLDGAVFSYSSTAVLVQGVALGSRIDISDSLNTQLTRINFPTMTGRDQQSVSGSFSVPVSDLAAFENTGTLNLTLEPFTACRGSAPTPSGCNEFSATVSGQVTYTYTPVLASNPVPEPRNLWLVTGGMVAVIFLLRLRLAAES